jgi:hypothetical protein
MERSCVRSHHSGHSCYSARHLVRPRRVKSGEKGEVERASTSVAKRSPALMEADKMEAILAEIDADRADGGG